MNELNLIVPTCHQELTPKQLRYLYTLLADGLDADSICTHALFRFAGASVDTSTPGVYVVSYESRKYNIRPEQVAELLPRMEWVLSVPVVPVRLPAIGKKNRKALYPASFDDPSNPLTFEKYLILDNLYQGYTHTKQYERIAGMAELLYGHIGRTSEAEIINILYWWASFKAHLSRRFPHFFHSAPVTNSEMSLQDLQSNLQRAVDTQIRALTGGDITKNAVILSMDVYAALTELDAKAEDYEEVKKLSKS